MHWRSVGSSSSARKRPAITLASTAQFGIAAHRAHTFAGLCARLYTKLTAHTLCLYLNRLLGVSEWLQIRALAFPAN